MWKHSIYKKTLTAIELAEEAHVISVYCALKSPSLKEALLMAVNHDGDLDSTGSISGNLIGAN
ncbi:ADP-ribosylglycohydrolase family protein [Microbulbifer sp. TRSA001]|uniref:ADP-ribosylglycohydrolase family protein n=1 Tax=Microbulbifer sp. TRSA001 TaxID=3243381 RepID=UPI0040394475